MINVLVSACLLGESCKYSGKSNYNQAVVDFIESLGGRVAVVPVCPEVMGGLPTPRTPSEIAGGRVMDKSGKDVTKAFLEGAVKVLQIAKEKNCRFAILKERSPSCGFGQVYDGTFTSTLVDGHGVTAGLLDKHGVEICGESCLGFQDLMPDSSK